MGDEKAYRLTVTAVSAFVVLMAALMCYGLYKDHREVRFGTANREHGIRCDKVSGAAWINENNTRHDLQTRDYRVICRGDHFAGKPHNSDSLIPLDSAEIYRTLPH
ncbi:hypothetical protein ACQFN5_00360 (plasmid) [Klebsiella sp. WOUb02]|uniref:hypothetical protein n=1 Tax=Klebsiella sp. WOUb02 TaxID=3161071 RepID=UPI003CF27E82